MKNSLFVIIPLYLTLVACNTTSGVLPMGPDTYSLSTSSEFGGTVEAKKLALTEANNYCKSMGKELLPLNTAQSVKPDWTGDSIGHYDIDFRCLGVGDEELQRPQINSVPDIVIKSN